MNTSSDTEAKLIAGMKIERRNASLAAPRSIFDLSESEFQRLGVLADAFEASTLRFSSNQNKMTRYDYMLIMIKGLELGMAPMAAVDLIDVIQGHPATGAKGMLALAYASGELENININSEDDKCTVTIKRVGKDAHSEVFSLKDAQGLGLMGRSGWKSQPRTMLKWRAISAAIRMVFPDYAAGLYTVEELDDSGSVVVTEDGSTLMLEAPKNVMSLNDKNVGAGAAPKTTASNSEKGSNTSAAADVLKPYWLDIDAGKAALRNKLADLGATSKEDYALYLSELNVKSFSDTRMSQDDLFTMLDRIFVAANPPAVPKKSAPKTSQPEPASEPETGEMEVDMVTYIQKGKKKYLEFGGFHPTLGSVRIYSFSRSEFLKQLGVEKFEVHNDDGETINITAVEPNTYEMDPVLIKFEITDGSKTSKIAKVLSAQIVVKSARTNDDEDIDPFDEFFGSDEAVATK